MATPDPAPEHAAFPRGRRPRHSRAWTVGMSVSVLGHLLFLLLYGGVAGPPAVTVSPGGEGASELTGIELLNLIARSEDLDRPEEPEEESERDPVPVAPRAAPASRDPASGAERGAGTVEPGPVGPAAAERLRVRLADARLWAPLASEEMAQLTLQQFLESDLAWRIGLWRDSAAAAAEAERRLTDWTYTDDEGNRWGVSPGKLHLGSITLPLPFGFGAPPGDAREREFINAELARGATSAMIHQTLRERADAIRRRRDREREEAREAASRAGPRRVRPDTTRVNRIP